MIMINFSFIRCLVSLPLIDCVFNVISCMVSVPLIDSVSPVSLVAWCLAIDRQGECSVISSH